VSTPDRRDRALEDVDEGDSVTGVQWWHVDLRMAGGGGGAAS
jgi:hypothetical protein